MSEYEDVRGREGAGTAVWKARTADGHESPRQQVSRRMRVRALPIGGLVHDGPTSTYEIRALANTTPWIPNREIGNTNVGPKS